MTSRCFSCCTRLAGCKIPTLASSGACRNRATPTKSGRTRRKRAGRRVRQRHRLVARFNEPVPFVLPMQLPGDGPRPAPGESTRTADDAGFTDDQRPLTLLFRGAYVLFDLVAQTPVATESKTACWLARSRSTTFSARPRGSATSNDRRARFVWTARPRSIFCILGSATRATSWPVPRRARIPRRATPCPPAFRSRLVRLPSASGCHRRPPTTPVWRFRPR